MIQLAQGVEAVGFSDVWEGGFSSLTLVQGIFARGGAFYCRISYNMGLRFLAERRLRIKVW